MTDLSTWTERLASRGGEMGRIIAAHDWAASGLGPIEGWSATIRTVVKVILASPVPQVLMVGADGLMIYNDGYAQIAGSRHPHILGQAVCAGWPEAVAFNRTVLDTVLAGTPLTYTDLPLVLYRNGGPEDLWFALAYSPVVDEDGQRIGVLGIVTETTERVRVQQELARSRERLAFALNSAGMIGTWDWHIGSNLFFPDARLADLFGPGKVSGEAGMPVEQYLESIHPDDIARVRDAFRTAIASKEKYSAEYRLKARDGGWRWVIARGECLYDHEGRPARFPGAIVDITELKESEEARSILLRELNHRVKNIFAVVSGLISMTARTAATPREMAEALRGRLSALAAAHDLIRSAVFGESHEAETTPLSDLLDRILAPHLGRPDQVRLTGPPVTLGASAATSLALVFHELATNAAKYGALAEEGGALDIAWTATSTEVTLHWTEHKATATGEAPIHRGFGSQLIAMSVHRQLKGAITYEWSRAGLRISLTAPIETLAR